jgi:hypothetical protein
MKNLENKIKITELETTNKDVLSLHFGEKSKKLFITDNEDDSNFFSISVEQLTSFLNGKLSKEDIKDDIEDSNVVPLTKSYFKREDLKNGDAIIDISFVKPTISNADSYKYKVKIEDLGVVKDLDDVFYFSTQSDYCHMQCAFGCYSLNGMNYQDNIIHAVIYKKDIELYKYIARAFVSEAINETIEKLKDKTWKLTVIQDEL